MPQIDKLALVHLKNAKRDISRQQYRTLRGQVLAGDSEGAMKGLRKILLLNTSNAIERGRR